MQMEEFTEARAQGAATPRVVVAAAPGTLAAAVVKATLGERLGVSEVSVAADFDGALESLPAELLLLDVRLAGPRAGEVHALRERHPNLSIVGLADRPDENTEACLHSAGICDVVLATDGQAAIALRLRSVLERSAPSASPSGVAAAIDTRWRRAFEEAPAPMAMLDLEGRWMDVNPALARMLGATPQDLVTRGACAVSPRSDAFMRLIAGELERATIDHEIAHSEGQAIPLRLTLAALRDGTGEATAVVLHAAAPAGSGEAGASALPATTVGPEESQVRTLEIELDKRLMDVVILGRLARSVTQAEDPLTDLCAAANRLLGADLCMIAAPSADGDAVVLSEVGEGVQAGEIVAPADMAGAIGRVLMDGDRLFIANAPGHALLPQAHVESAGAASVLIEPIIAGENLLGSLVFAWRETAREPGHRDVAVLRALGAEAANMLERYSLLQAMNEVSRLDTLTGLGNRAAWDERLLAEVAGATRRCEPLSIILVDVDNFGAYNQRFGQPAGDELLRKLAGAWRQPLRVNDYVARIGADEFAFILPDCGGTDADFICERLHNATAGMATFGAAVAVWDGISTAEQLMAAAEQVLAEARAAAAGNATARTS